MAPEALTQRASEPARALLVAGVAGGVGTSTWSRLLQLAFSLPVVDLREYRGGVVDVLVTSNTAASTARIGPALAVCSRPPILVVMHTVPGVIAESRSHLRKVQPHISAQFTIAHQRSWLEMANAPGPKVSVKARDVTEALNSFPHALQQMYAPRHPSGMPASGVNAPAAAVVSGNRLAGDARAGPLGHQRWAPQGYGSHHMPVHRGQRGG